MEPPGRPPLFDALYSSLEALRDEEIRRAEDSERRRRVRAVSFYTSQFAPRKYQGATEDFLHMSAARFDELLRRVRPLYDSGRNAQISVEEKLVLTLDYLISGQALHRLAASYGLSVGSVHAVLKLMLRLIKDALSDQVRIPRTAQQWLRVAERFGIRWQLPHCIGAMDGKHIRFKSPNNSGSENFNYKHFFSFQLMALVDADRRFLFYDVGSKGRNNDAYVFRSSQLFQALENGSANIPDPDRLPASEVIFPYFIAADGIYPLSRYLMKPFPGVQLTAAQRTYNYRISRGRNVVENSFGMLASRFRIIKMGTELQYPQAVAAVEAAIHLHNFLSDDDVHLEIEEEQPEALDEENVEDDLVGAAALRNLLMNYFSTEGAL